MFIVIDSENMVIYENKNPPFAVSDNYQIIEVDSVPLTRENCYLTYANGEFAEHEYPVPIGEQINEDGAVPTPKPTMQDRLEAQVLYTALMTDTLIEGE